MKATGIELQTTSDSNTHPKILQYLENINSHMSQLGEEKERTAC